MSPEDQRAFDRWLKANAVVGLIFAAAFIGMALVGSTSSPHDPATANGMKGSDVSATVAASK